MEIKSIKIHNFRSIKDIEFEWEQYNVLVGANNSGKSNILKSLQLFYGDEFKDQTDFPKFQTDDKESWIEIEYLLTDNEIKNLGDNYQNPDNILRVRKYLKSEDILIQKLKTSFFAYVKGELSKTPFYSIEDISQGKLGYILYIPAMSRTEDNLKLSGPSALRDILTFVMNKVIKTGDSFRSLNDAFEEFNKKCQEKTSGDGISLEDFRKKINENLKEWKVEFNLNINPPKIGDIIKSMLSYSFKDKNLNENIDIKLYGQRTTEISYLYINSTFLTI